MVDKGQSSNLSLNNALNRIIPVRFLSLTAHLIITVLLFWGMEESTRECLGVDLTSSDYARVHPRMLIGYSFTLAFLLVEYAGFLSGVSMFRPAQCLLSIGAHITASVSLAFYVFESWSCEMYWWIFGLCSAFPAVIELGCIATHSKGLGF